MRLIILGIAWIFFQCAKPERTFQGSDFPRELERLKGKYPGFELCLCGGDSSHANLWISKVFWDHDEKPICQIKNGDTFRIIYWSRISGWRIFSLENRDSGYYLVHKNREWIDTGNSGFMEVHEQEVRIEETESKRLFGFVEKTRLDQDSTRICLDGTQWNVEMIKNGSYNYFRFACLYTKEVTALGNELKNILGLSFHIP